ncbi:MAG: ferrous iron transport protein B [Chthoniobacterales bacterium]
MSEEKFHPKRYAVVGNPNSGKTTLFNALTGLRQKVGNYPGVTVEKKSGQFIGQHGEKIELLDLPGSYSLSAHAPDEQITRDVLLGLRSDTPRPERLLCVVDASHLERNLYFITQVLELRLPTIIALNMIDLAKAQGMAIDVKKLSKELGVPIIPCQANEKQSLLPLRLALSRAELESSQWAPELPSVWSRAIDVVAAVTASQQVKLEVEKQRKTEKYKGDASTDDPNDRITIPRDNLVRMRAVILLAAPDTEIEMLAREMYAGVALGVILAQRSMLDRELPSWREELVSARYQRIGELCHAAQGRSSIMNDRLTQRLDDILTHPIWGWFVFLSVMGLMFVSIFAIAPYPMSWIEAGFDALGDLIKNILPPGDFRDLLADGVIAGIGGVVIFLPQILILFFFIGLLEDTGYMARAAFLMDRVMSKVGLHGKSFIPLLSSYACAIPGIMATRTIENRKDRLVTILVAPLMTCSARLPVYAVMITALFPLGTISVWIKGAIMMGLYLLGTVAALLFAGLFKKTILRGEPPVFLMELPSYHLPALRQVVIQMWHRSRMFLKRAGTVILGISILLWFLASFPKPNSSDQDNRLLSKRASADEVQGDYGAEKSDKATQLETSYAGRFGHVIEPVIAPLGFDWKIGIGLIAAQAAREVFVSTMSIVYHVEGSDKKDTTSLRAVMPRERRLNGELVYTPLTCLSILLFFVFSMQCISTLAVVRRETSSWRWPIFQFCYMTGTAYLVSLIVYQGGLLLGFK